MPSEVVSLGIFTSPIMRERKPMSRFTVMLIAKAITYVVIYEVIKTANKPPKPVNMN
jgi:hypothetical protein